MARKATKQVRNIARMELRIAPSAKAFIRRAMAVSGRSAGELAYEGAKRVLEEHEQIVLRGRDREVFLEALRNPPAPSKRLIAAMRRHAELTK